MVDLCKIVKFCILDYEKILVLGTGRGIFWSEVLKRVDGMIGAQQMPLEFLDRPLSSDAFDFWRARARSYSELIVCPTDSCSGNWLCRSCLKEIKKWAGFPDRKWCVRWHTVAVQTDVSSMAPQRKVPGSSASERIDLCCASMATVVAKKVKEILPRRSKQ